MAAEVEVAVAVATCECCGLAEECTGPYMALVRGRFGGRWVCGLCAEAVQDEMNRAGPTGPISAEEAVGRHAGFCSALRADPAERLIAAVRALLKRSLTGARPSKQPAASSSVLLDPGSCFSTLAQ